MVVKKIHKKPWISHVIIQLLLFFLIQTFFSHLTILKKYLSLKMSESVKLHIYQQLDQLVN